MVVCLHILNIGCWLCCIKWTYAEAGRILGACPRVHQRARGHWGGLFQTTDASSKEIQRQKPKVHGYHQLNSVRWHSRIWWQYDASVELRMWRHIIFADAMSKRCCKCQDTFWGICAKVLMFTMWCIPSNNGPAHHLSHGEVFSSVLKQLQGKDFEVLMNYWQMPANRLRLQCWSWTKSERSNRSFTGRLPANVKNISVTWQK